MEAKRHENHLDTAVQTTATDLFSESRFADEIMRVPNRRK
jgi:hypothetical protein